VTLPPRADIARLGHALSLTLIRETSPGGLPAFPGGITLQPDRAEFRDRVSG
jgi:hypothetical protein